MSAIIVRDISNHLGRNDVQRFPLRHFLGKLLSNRNRVVVFDAGRAIAANPRLSRFAALARFANFAGRHSTTLKDDSEELFAHFTSLGLTFYFIAVNHASAV